jgi:hypothetical protein
MKRGFKNMAVAALVLGSVGIAAQSVNEARRIHREHGH